MIVHFHTTHNFYYVSVIKHVTVMCAVCALLQTGETEGGIDGKHGAHILLMKPSMNATKHENTCKCMAVV